MPHIIYPIQRGNANMGDKSDETNRTARFAIEQDNMTLLFVRIDFVNGTLTADLSLYLDKKPSSLIPKTFFKLFTWKAVGSTKQIHTRIPIEERPAWAFSKGDELVFEWVNPESGVIEWAIEIGVTNGQN